MPIRIMHVVDSLGNGGLENGLVNLINGLDGDLFEHVVFTMRGQGPNADRLPKERVHIASLPESEKCSRLQMKALVQWIRRFQPDIVHSRNWGTIEAVPAGRWIRCSALIHSEHGLESDSETEPWRRRCFRKLAYAMADRVIAVSHHLKDLCARRAGFPARRIEVIHNGVDAQRFRADSVTRARVRSELALSNDEFCIGAVGNLLPIKDHLTLLKAVEHMDARSRPWPLVIAGEGPERVELHSFLSSRPRLRDRVLLAGARKDVRDLLNGIDAYVLPSRLEGISNSLLEAMATGLPVIVAPVGGNTEVVVEGESGLFFPSGDFHYLAEALLTLQRQPDRLAQLAEGAVLRVRQHFSITSMLNKYADVYETAARRSAVPARVMERT
jgi:sugar transferase (PEP-CTERM/EpsH1 system associated)